MSSLGLEMVLRTRGRCWIWGYHSLQASSLGLRAARCTTDLSLVVGGGRNGVFLLTVGVDWCSGCSRLRRMGSVQRGWCGDGGGGGGVGEGRGQGRVARGRRSHELVDVVIGRDLQGICY